MSVQSSTVKCKHWFKNAWSDAHIPHSTQTSISDLEYMQKKPLNIIYMYASCTKSTIIWKHFKHFKPQSLWWRVLFSYLQCKRRNVVRNCCFSSINVCNFQTRGVDFSFRNFFYTSQHYCHWSFLLVYILFVHFQKSQPTQQESLVDKLW